MTALSQKEQSCIVLEIASYDILVGFWFFSAIDVIMWCEGQCLPTLPFIYCTQQDWWTRRSVATSLTSVPGSPDELVRSSAIFSCRALVPECLSVSDTQHFSGPQTLSCAGRSTCWFFLSYWQDAEVEGSPSLPPNTLCIFPQGYSVKLGVLPGKWRKDITRVRIFQLGKPLHILRKL